MSTTPLYLTAAPKTKVPAYTRRKDIGIRDLRTVQSHGVVLGLHISDGKDRVCRQMLLLLHRDYGEMLLVLFLQIINPNSRCKEDCPFELHCGENGRGAVDPSRQHFKTRQFAERKGLKDSFGGFVLCFPLDETAAIANAIQRKTERRS
ncbi:hypothetical protein SUGI_0385290 [Cryptomeria japonica]|nr:hypothetical protein SUGI_0385290 [Cryptomeria japonica]